MRASVAMGISAHLLTAVREFDSANYNFGGDSGRVCNTSLECGARVAMIMFTDRNSRNDTRGDF
jgi:hypothetical protein